ncbi:hypothetical protein NMG60_11003457 [Bertholletia excelsa]
MTSLEFMPTWSLASILASFIAVSLLVGRLIHCLSNWLKEINRKPLVEAVEKIKEELMLMGFTSLLVGSSNLTKICIPSKLYSNSSFVPCSAPSFHDKRSRGVLIEGQETHCRERFEPIISYEGLEQLHHLIFIMAVTHVSYSCLTMLLAVVKVHSWRMWEDEARMNHHNSFSEVATQRTMRRQSTFLRARVSNPLVTNRLRIWVTCFFQQFGQSVVRSDYLALRTAFIVNHNLKSNFDFHKYMVCSMEEEFQKIVGVSGPLWLFSVGLVLFNVKGFHLHLWMAMMPVILVLVIGAKLQHVIATLALESTAFTRFPSGENLMPRDDLFWFKKPELLLSLIHFALFQNAFTMASFLWTWFDSGYVSCFMKNYAHVYAQLMLGFGGQFLCSYSTLPLYALVTQMGSNYKAALIPQRIRETIHEWGETARRRRRRHISTHVSTVEMGAGRALPADEDIDSQPPTVVISSSPSPLSNEASTRVLKTSFSDSSVVARHRHPEALNRSRSMPVR